MYKRVSFFNVDINMLVFYQKKLTGERNTCDNQQRFLNTTFRKKKIISGLNYYQKLLMFIG